MSPTVDIILTTGNAMADRLRRFSVWRVLEPVFEHFIYPFYRTSSQSSFGKLWSSILLFTCMYFWLQERAVPESLTTMIQTMLVYVYATKPMQIARDHVERKTSKKGSEASAEPAEVPA